MQNSMTLTRQRQIRGFVIAWLGVTLLMGALTFIGIYYATGLVGEDSGTRTVSAAAINSSPADSAASAPQNAAPPPAEEPSAANVAPAVNSVPAGDSAPAGNGGAAFAQDATPVPTITPLPVQNQAFQLGIQVQGNPDPSVYQLWMGEVRDKLKLGWIKQQVRWEFVEPQPGQYDWGALDVAMELAAEYNIKVMLSVVTAPEWAREEGNQRLDEVGPPGNPQDYANFLLTMLYRYPGQIHAIEVWNEMNIDREWASIYGLSAQKYVELLTAAYNTIKSVDPGIIVISGALSPTGWNDGVAAYDDFVYMDMLINAGMLNVADCVGAHHNGYNVGPGIPWNQVPNDPNAFFRGPFDNPHHSWTFYSTLQGYAQRIQQAGSDKKLCITEFGWPTSEDLQGTPVGFEFARDNTLAEQADYIDEAIRLMDQWDFVWLAFVWNLNYGPQSGWDPTNDNVVYSLIRPDWKPSPAYERIAAYDFRNR